ncbi:MAG TPA: hypothetical protein VHG92_10115 [Afifellaceae bacterium]|nr:hypothetical protein [Afifellaceae bacterium]
MRKVILAGAAMLALTACSSSGTGTGGTGGTTVSDLINVNLSNVAAEIAKNVNLDLSRVPITVQLPITVAANVCGVDVNLLSAQVSTGSNTCTATTTSPQLEQEVVNTIQ